MIETSVAVVFLVVALASILMFLIGIRADDTVR
jgi:hypothetical protein